MDSEGGAENVEPDNDTAGSGSELEAGSPLQNAIANELSMDASFLPSADAEEDDNENDAGEQKPAEALPTRLEIELPLRPHNAPEEYSIVVSDVIDCVHRRVSSSSRETTYEVEFTDGRLETITLDQILEYDNGDIAMHDFMDASHVGKRVRKRKYAPDTDWESDAGSEDEIPPADQEIDDDEEISSRRSSRIILRSKSTNVDSRRSLTSPEDPESDDAPSRRLRPRRTLPLSTVLNTKDEDQNESSDDDDDFRPVTSDLHGVGRPRRGHRRPTRQRRLLLRKSLKNRRDDDSDIAFEAPRRSSRATRQTYTVDDDVLMDDDSFYREDDEKSVGAPKIASVKEIFISLPVDSLFSLSHIQHCHVCDGSKNKGQLINCQGCSLSYHKGCIGLRSQREHLVTKIGEADFVLQCKFCLGLPAAKDTNAPNYASCQSCRSDGRACAPFSRKLTARQEEKLRDENAGVDPSTAVAPDLINNDELVLFRCTACHRSWHKDHLPLMMDLEGDELIKSYMNSWQCKQCQETQYKIHRLVAWRHAQPAKSGDANKATCVETLEDDKEYLIKWETKSYFHCTWQPGSWVYGVSNALMRKAFQKRDIERSLLKYNEQDAVPEEYLTADIVLCAKMSSSAPRADSKEEELSNVQHVRQILVKFQGLSYNDVVWDTPPSEDTGSIYHAFVNAYREYVKGKYFQQASNMKIKERVKAFKNAEFVEITEQPASMKRGKLMGYQVEGLNWLLGNYHHGRSVVLADEMGLGKTVQVISLITSLVQDSPKCWPFLIVVPNATCPNWRREFKQWSPDLRVVTYHGGKVPQELAYKYELFPDHSGGMRAHAVIMSYDSAQDPRTPGLFKSVNWAGLVVDEGQRLKNDQNLLYQALLSMKIPFRLLLTGTPLQNNKRELFNLLQFIDSTQNAESLDAQYAVLDKVILPKLHDKIRPYFLRRTKAGVLKFLPPMAQIIIPVTMTVIQEKLSKSIMSKNPQLIKAMFANSKLNRNDRGSLNNILIQLRKCLCHPFMYSEAIEEKHQDPTVVQRNLVEASAKLLLLQIMLPKLKERGHRVLIFSQFLQQLDIVEDFLNGLGYQYRRLDGQISSLEKQKRIDAFNAPESGIFAFLLSTRAGGVGINLATADTVIIMDPDFNPHQDIQALSRAHRIGQKKRVLCFQLMTKDTVEERIMQIGRTKMALDHALIESMDDDELEGADLESILRHGASALFNDDYQKSAINYDSAMVDKLLDRSQAEAAAASEEAPGETPFSYARVWDTDKTGFDGLATAEDEAPQAINSSVWDEILAQREEEARRHAEANREILGRGQRRRTNINYNSNALAPDADGATDRLDTDDDFAAHDSTTDDDDAAALRRAEGAEELANLGEPRNKKAYVNAIASKATHPDTWTEDELSSQKVTTPDLTPQQPSAQSRKRGRPKTIHKQNTQPQHHHNLAQHRLAAAGNEGTVENKPPPPMELSQRQQHLMHEFSSLLYQLRSEAQVRLAIDHLVRNVPHGVERAHQLGALYGRLHQIQARPAFKT